MGMEEVPTNCTGKCDSDIQTSVGKFKYILPTPACLIDSSTQVYSYGMVWYPSPTNRLINKREKTFIEDFQFLLSCTVLTEVGRLIVI